MGANYGTNTFGDVFGPNNYKGYSLVGATLNVPIFGSGLRKHRIDQARIELDKTNNNIDFLKQISFGNSNISRKPICKNFCFIWK